MTADIFCKSCGRLIRFDRWAWVHVWSGVRLCSDHGDATAEP